MNSVHADSIWAATWAPRADLIITGSLDEQIKLWSVSTFMNDDSLKSKGLMKSLGRASRWNVFIRLMAMSLAWSLFL